MNLNQEIQRPSIASPSFLVGGEKSVPARALDNVQGDVKRAAGFTRAAG